LAASSGKQKPPGEEEEQVPAWAKPGADEPPPWAREGGAARGQEEAGQVPFYAYLLASAITAIAAVRAPAGNPIFLFAAGRIFTDENETAPQIGSIFEYTNQRPVFGIVGSDSALYAPILGFFVFTGIPTSVRIPDRGMPPIAAPALSLTEECRPCTFSGVSVVQGRADGEQRGRGARPQRRIPVRR
jgi:hypothetical protein